MFRNFFQFLLSSPLILKQVYLRPAIDNFELPILLFQYDSDTTVCASTFGASTTARTYRDANDPPLSFYQLHRNLIREDIAIWLGRLDRGFPFRESAVIFLQRWLSESKLLCLPKEARRISLSLLNVRHLVPRDYEISPRCGSLILFIFVHSFFKTEIID